MSSLLVTPKLYKFIGIFEIVTSILISAFGTKALLICLSQDKKFRTDKWLLEHCSAAAIVSAISTILVCVYLMACGRHKVVDENERVVAGPSTEAMEEKTTLHVKTNFLPPKLWLLYSPIHFIAMLFVIVGPLTYCIQTEEDLEEIKALQSGMEGAAVVVNEYGRQMPIPRCYAVTEQMQTLRSMFKELLTYTIITAILKPILVWRVHKEIVSQKQLHEEGKLFDLKIRESLSKTKGDDEE